MGNRPAGPPPEAAPPNSDDSESSSTDAEQYQSLMEIIQELAEQESDPKALAQLVVDALYGLDQTA